jgi:hypothetical protein
LYLKRERRESRWIEQSERALIVRVLLQQRMIIVGRAVREWDLIGN